MSIISWDLIDAATREESNRGRSKTVCFTEGLSPECVLLRHTALGEREDAPGRQYPQMHMLSGSKYWLADVGAGLAFTAGNTQTAGQKGKITQDIILGYLTNVCMHHRFILSSSKGQSAALWTHV